ncbi:hypothetical protein T484DRAFT_1820098 [Baffinella frigidus]|nr:hypothetical protein T484DRAFT_1820098 [Cryptophyta sp. CCMP2293]
MASMRRLAVAAHCASVQARPQLLLAHTHTSAFAKEVCGELPGAPAVAIRTPEDLAKAFAAALALLAEPADGANGGGGVGGGVGGHAGGDGEGGAERGEGEWMEREVAARLISSAHSLGTRLRNKASHNRAHQVCTPLGPP